MPVNLQRVGGAGADANDVTTSLRIPTGKTLTFQDPETQIPAAGLAPAPLDAPEMPDYGIAEQVHADASGRGGLLVYADGTLGGRGKYPITSALLQHRAALGQSLSLGTEGDPVISGTAEYPNYALMFNTGATVGLESPGATSTVVDFAAITGLLPLVETAPGGANDVGETIGSGLTRQLVEARLSQDTSAPIPRTLFSASGVGGQAFAALKRGTVPYENAMKLFRRGKALADTLGYFYEVPAFYWLQGEADLPATTQATYFTNLVALQKDLSRDVSSILSFSANAPLLIYQISGFSINTTAPGTVAAQLQAQTSDFPVYVVTPTYIFPCARNNSTHLTAEGYYLLGEYFAKAEAAAIAGTWDVVRPVSSSRTGAVIDVVFNVPVGPLVFDTALFDDPGDEGFRYTDSGGTISVSSAVIQGDGVTVRVTLSADPSANSARTLYYGYPGVTGVHTVALDGELHPIARGRLRDSDDTPSSLDGRELNNWCVHFTLSV